MSTITSSFYHPLTDPINQISAASVVLAIVLIAYFLASFTELSALQKAYNSCKPFITFAYSCFFKPHTGDGTGNQQDALESFYSSQASVYDATRAKLLQGREDTLALVAAQMKHRREQGQITQKPIWVDVGGGTLQGATTWSTSSARSSARTAGPKCAMLLHEVAEQDAAVTESPFISALDLQQQALHPKKRRSSSAERRSKMYDTAVVNLASSLPLPAAYYQNNKTRIYYDHSLAKHTQFNDEYIYAFTWEDSRTDARLLKITNEDMILAITSAGDNILSYALERPKRIHAVDLNPAQNNLLELKVAAFRALEYQDMWKLFGEGKHDNFQKVLVEKLSPYLSSQAFDYWLHVGPQTFNPKGKGFYFTGGSRHALQLIHWLGSLLGVRKDMNRLCEVQTLAEQREIWTKRVRRVLLSQLLAYFVIGSERFLWKALGVPGEQRAMIEEDYQRASGDRAPSSAAEKSSGTGQPGEVGATKSGQAIWNYGVQTLDPVANDTLVSEDNHYYLVCLLGHYTRRCHPDYLTPKAHLKLSAPGALDNLRIHTDELAEVFARMQPESLTIAVLMDSMDWFPPSGPEAPAQVLAVNRALKAGGRVLIRSSGLNPWYMRVFEESGFAARRVAARVPPGTCTDRVNMYASTWICTKVVGVGEVEET
ncbi:hypothetical protein LTR87_013417 [Friedmanniomyces endolithicus]|nr:hypothetical protein LTR87_013417 [Friedmanniomyces endolithicus]